MTNNEQSRKWVYETARNEGWKVGKDYEAFENLINPTPQPTTADKALYTFTESELSNENPKPVAAEEKGDLEIHPYGAQKPLIEAPDIRQEETFSVPYNAERVVEDSMQRAKQALTPPDAWTQAQRNAFEKIGERERAATVRKQAEEAVGDMRKRIADLQIKRGEEVRKMLPLGAPGPMQNDAITRGGKMLDPEYSTLQAASDVIADTEKMVDDYNARSEWGIVNIGKSAAKTAFNPKTWDLGLSDTNIAEKLLVAVEKADNGKQLTEAEQLLLDAAVNQQVMQWYYGEMTAGQMAGEMFAESLPFMVQIAANPISGIGKYAASKATKAVSKWAIKKLGEKGLKAIVKKVAMSAPKAAAVTTRALGNVAGGYGMAMTSNIGNTTADALQRQVGDIQLDFDENGIAKYDGRTNIREAGEAWRQAINNQGAEFVSEQMGMYFKPLFKGIGKVTGKVLDGIGAGKVNRWLDDFGKKGVGKKLKSFTEATQWNGFAEEYGEEIANGIMNSVLVGDQTMGEVFSKDNLIDTAIGLSVMSTIMPAISTVNYARTKNNERKALNESYQNGQSLFGTAWEDFAGAVQTAKDGRQISENLRNVMNKYGEKTLPVDMQKAVLDYAMAYNRYNAMEKVSAMAVREGVVDARDLEQERIYAQGVSAEDKYAVRQAFETARDEVAYVLGVTADEVPEIVGNDDTGFSIADDYDVTGEQEKANAIRTYLAARAQHSGMIATMVGEMNAEIAAVDAHVDATANEDGNVYAVTLQTGETGYVTGGNVILDNDGYIDVSATNEANPSGLFITIDGVTKPFSADKVKDMGVVQSAEQVKELAHAPILTAYEDRYNAMTASPQTQEDVQTQTTAQNVAPQTEITFNPGDTYTINDNGVLKEIEIEQDMGDGSIRVLIDGKHVFMQPEYIAANIVAPANEGQIQSDIQPQEHVEEPAAEQQPVLSPQEQRKARLGEIAKRIPTKGKTKLWTQAKAEDVAEYIMTLTDDVAKQQATADRYIADIKEKQAKMDAIEALELDEDIAFWESVKGFLTPETQTDEAALLRKAEEERLRAEREEAERIEREALNGVPDMVDDTPQDARARGYRRVSGHKIDRQEPLQAVQGKEVAVRFSDDAIANGRVAV
ncbi:MAG: hypothetical protein E7088_09315, partial [Bacteroidales bacterium]|nr:hypothetical protein [Bacteroidales bacterium]